MKTTQHDSATSYLNRRIHSQSRLLSALGTMAILAAAISFMAVGSGFAGKTIERGFVREMPAGYRDWRLISVAREEGTLNDIRAILGNDLALQAYRDGKLPFPEGAIIARLAWEHSSSEENNAAFGRRQSFVAGAPKNGVQFMVKDSTRYASTGGWGYGHFDDGAPASNTFMESCYPCHRRIESRDFVFTRYAP